jgi:hypothetical protein
MIKLAVLIVVSAIAISFGVAWYRRGLAAEQPYDFREDFKHTFITPHLDYSGYLNDGKPRRIAPMIVILGGVGLLVWGAVRFLPGI